VFRDDASDVDGSQQDEKSGVHERRQHFPFLNKLSPSPNLLPDARVTSKNVHHMKIQNYFLTFVLLVMAGVQLNAQQFFFSAERPASCGSSDGIITIVPTRGVPPFTYLWSTGTTEVSAKNLPKGTYSATLTDATGATVTHTHILNSEEFDLYLADSRPSSNCNPNSGMLQINPVGGVAPFTYAWSNGQTSATAQGLTIGTYSVTVQDATGCVAEGEYSVGPTLGQYYPYAEIEHVEEPDCTNPTTGELKAHLLYSNYPPYSYTWNTGATSEVLSALSAGTYSVTVTDALGCSTSTSTVLRKELTMTGSIICTGSNTGTASAFLVNATVPVNYSWSNAQTGATITNLSNGFYSVTATDANGCISSGRVVVRVPTLSLYDNSPKCYSGNNGIGSCWLNNDLAVSYLWDNGVTDGWNPSLSPGPHSITVTTALGCTLTGSLNIAPPVAPPFAFSYTTTSADCTNGAGGSLNVAISGGVSPYTFYAYGPDGFFTSNIASLQNVKAGTYSLTVSTNGLACYGQTTAVVADAGGFEPTLQVAQIDCITGYGSAEVLGVTTPGVQYTWSQGTTASSSFNLSQGCYKVTVSAGASCTQYYEFCLFSEDSIQTNSKCGGLATGILINDLGVAGCTGNTGIPYQLIRTLPTGALNFTDANGVYNVQLPTGMFDIETANYDPADIACPPTGQHTVNSVVGSTASGLDFHFYNSNAIDYQVKQKSLRTAQPGYPYSTRFEVCNDGGSTQVATVELEYGNFLGSVVGVSFAQHPGAVAFVSETFGIPNNTATFTLPALAPGTCELFQVDFVTPVTTPVSTAFISKVKVTPINGDPTPDNNVSAVYNTVVGSFDPNSVLSYPARNGNPHDGGDILRNTDKTIKYQIYFQNTGNAPADRVIVRDVLDAHLDVASIRGITASHDMKVTMEEDNKVLVFTFNNINLLDSTSNYAASIGSIQYEIDLKPGVQVGDLIQKEAAIFFDFNSPVITNNNVLKVTAPNSVHSTQPENSLIVSPNPANTYFSVTGTSAAELSIFNALGSRLHTQQVTAGTQQINTSELPNGIYLIRLDMNGVIQSGKVVVAH